jgi:ATP-binding cassette, subfamily B, bacterial PglK
MLASIWRHISKRRKKQFYLLLFLMILSSLTEVISIGTVIPFLAILAAPEQVFYHPLMQDFIYILENRFGFLAITEPSELIFPLTCIFITAILLSTSVRLVLLYVGTKLAHLTGADFSIKTYYHTLYQDYAIHTARNSSEIINGIIVKTGAAVGIIQSFLNLISSAILTLGIMSALITIDRNVAIIATTSFGLFYLIVVYVTKKQIKQNGQTIADNSTLMVKSLQEGLGGIRDILIDSSQQFYTAIYRNADLPLRRAISNNIFMQNSPRHIMEALGMTVIAGIAYVMIQKNGGDGVTIPVLGALALGAQRLLPALQQSYLAYSSINSLRASFNDLINLLEQPLPNYIDQPLPSPIKFKKEIQLKNLSFKYTEDTPWVLKDVNLKMVKGERIGFIGITGSGKSTLLDITMALLSPTMGEISIDGEVITKENRRAWQAHIAHVPQNIFLSDASIEENIAFGIPKNLINHEQIKKSAKEAQISELIEGWKDGYQTFVGERGIRLSGGQRQRIGIARALYRQTDVLILDEATSALDNETEQAVMKAIENLGRDITIIIIAHRKTTLKGCDQIVEVSKEGVKNWQT